MTNQPEIKDNRKCLWCGKAYQEHKNYRKPGDPILRTPCGGLKADFMPRANCEKGA